MLTRQDVYDALLRDAKSWILQRYHGGRRKLSQWDDNYTHLVSVRSNSFGGDRRKNLRQLDKLAKEGLIVEVPRSYQGQMRSFKLPNQAIEKIGQEAVRYWESKGYSVNVMMDEIQEGEGDE